MSIKITKFNIIEKFGKENNRIILENARILKRKKNEKKKKKIVFYCVFCLPQWPSYYCLNFESCRQI